MGLNSFFAELQGVFGMLTSVYASFPYMIKYLIVTAFGGMIYITVLRSIWR